MDDTYLKKISINGRFAIGVLCLKSVLRDRNIHWMPEIRTIIEKLSAFTSSSKLDVWEKEICAYLPDTFENGGEIYSSLYELNKEFSEQKTPQNRTKYYDDVAVEVLSEEFYDSLMKVYSGLDADIKKLFELCVEIGTGNLYAGVAKHSEWTLKPLKQILSSTQLYDEFDFEHIALKYPFKEKGGWGRKFKMISFTQT